MSKLNFLALASAVCFAACSNMANDDVSAAGDMAQDTASRAAGAVAARTSNTTSAYVTAAAIGDAYEIRSSQLALQRSRSEAVKGFAQEMITAHTATTNELKSLAQAAGQTPPSDLDSRRRSMFENLEKASADDFDDRYIDQQTAAHTEALALHRSYANQGDNAQLKAFASKTAPAVEHHLAMVKELDKSSADDAAK